MEGSCEYIEKQSRTADEGWSSSWGLGEELELLTVNNDIFTEGIHVHGPGMSV